jgi:hypothetical protein
VREDLLDDTGGLERPERLVVETDPAGIVDQFLAGVSDDRARVSPTGPAPRMSTSVSNGLSVEPFRDVAVEIMVGPRRQWRAGTAECGRTAT